MVYDKENGGYTDTAMDFSSEFKLLVEDLILQYMNEKGMEIQDIMYIADGDIQSICLRNMLYNKIK